MLRTLKNSILPFGFILNLLLIGGSTVATAQDLEPRTVYDLDASEDGVYYSLRSNEIVPAEEVGDLNWDLRLQGTAISVNGEARLLERAFDLVAQAPEDGYRTDDPSEGNAIPTANHEGWYDYDPNSHVVMAIPERTIVLRLVDDTYAKLEILSYYEGQMPELGSPRFYTFRFVRQPDGSRSFR
jgi:hypothetical protein